METDKGYDNEKLAKDLEEIAEKHQALQLLQANVIEPFYCINKEVGYKDSNCLDQCIMCERAEKLQLNVL
tara:strand:- start:66 stop:275 length:210 start_codon:yes stop_codon:yes gene_type:complete